MERRGSMRGGWTDGRAGCAPGRAIVLEVERIALDGVAFRDLWHRCGGNADAVACEVEESVARHGGLLSPGCGTGGTLGGTIALAVGADARIGSRIVTIDAAPAVALELREVLGIVPHLRQLGVRGRAVVAPHIRTSAIPYGWPLGGALSVLGAADVVALVREAVRPGERVLVMGASGIAGTLATFMAAERTGAGGRVVALVPCPGQRMALPDLPDNVIPAIADATDRRECLGAVLGALEGHLADFTVDCTTARGTEAAGAACTRPGGRVWFFNLAAAAYRAHEDECAQSRHLRVRFGSGAFPDAPGEALALVGRHDPLSRRFARGRDAEPGIHGEAGRLPILPDLAYD